MASFCSFEYSTFNSNLHGQGLRADVDVKEKDVVFMEKPLFMLQTIPNRKHVLACGNCYKFLGGLNIQSQFLLQNVSRQDDLSVHNVPIFDETTSSLTDIIPCKYCCGEYYCSSACRDCHCNDRGHELLCTGQIRDDEAESHPLIQFKMHAITTNEIFLLVAQIFASFCQSADKLVKSGWTVELAIKEVASIFDGYVKELWWDAAKTPKDSDPDEFKNKLKQLVADAYTLLNKCLKLAVKGYSLVLNEEYMSR